MMRIGLTYTGSPEKHGNYVRWLKGAGADAREVGVGGAVAVDGNRGGGEGIEVIRLWDGDDNFDAIRSCDGLVLSGGVDIHPSLYGGQEAYLKAPLNGWEKKRDLFEQSVLEWVLEHGIPVLGVCRGLQLINITLRGTLVQDLGERGDYTHENTAGIDKRHPVAIGAGSLLHAVVGEKEGEVNSAHHQAIRQLGEGLRVNCAAGDGTIEGIEWADPAGRPFMLGVQWHPERMYTNQLPDTPLYGRIRDRFLEEIIKSSAAR